jgi:hypothetical protein
MSSSSSESDTSDSDTSDSLSFSSQSPRSPDGTLPPSAAAAGDSDNDVNSSGSNSTDSNFGLPHPSSVGRMIIVNAPKGEGHLSLSERMELYAERARAEEAQRSKQRKPVTFRTRDSMVKQGAFFIDEKDPVATAAEEAAKTGQSRLQWELVQRTRAVNEHQRELIAKSVRVLRQHFFVDEPACDALQAMSTAQRMFCRGTRDALKDALLLCKVALLKPILAVEKAAAMLPASTGSRGRKQHQQQQQQPQNHLSPESSAETKRVLLEAHLTRGVLEGFMKTCLQGVRGKPIGSLLNVNLTQKAEM